MKLNTENFKTTTDPWGNNDKPMSWIKPQDQMPEEGKPVLITDNEGLQVVAWFQGGNTWHEDKWHSENYFWFTNEVLYWMPIPEIPKP